MYTTRNRQGSTSQLPSSKVPTVTCGYSTSRQTRRKGGAPSVRKTKAHRNLKNVAPQDFGSYIGNALADVAVGAAADLSIPAAKVLEATEWYKTTRSFALRIGWIEAQLWDAQPRDTDQNSAKEAETSTHKFAKKLDEVGKQACADHLFKDGLANGHRLTKRGRLLFCSGCGCSKS